MEPMKSGDLAPVQLEKVQGEPHPAAKQLAAMFKKKKQKAK